MLVKITDKVPKFKELKELLSRDKIDNPEIGKEYEVSEDLGKMLLEKSVAEIVEKPPESKDPPPPQEKEPVIKGEGKVVHIVITDPPKDYGPFEGRMQKKDFDKLLYGSYHKFDKKTAGFIVRNHFGIEIQNPPKEIEDRESGLYVKEPFSLQNEKLVPGHKLTKSQLDLIDVRFLLENGLIEEVE